MNQVQEYLKRNFQIISRFLEVSVIIAWLISQVIPSVDDWMREQRVIELIILVLVAELIAKVIDLKKNITHPLVLSADQGQSSKQLIQKIEESRPSIAKFIGLSAGKREDLLNVLTRSQWEINLLIQHPEAAMNEDLKHHLEEKIKELSNITFLKYSKVEIRLYKRPCFIRGTKIGRVSTSLGWYACGEGAYELFGHSNPVLSASEGSDESEYLNNFFDRAFEYLWNHKDTLSLNDYFIRGR